MNQHNLTLIDKKCHQLTRPSHIMVGIAPLQCQCLNLPELFSIGPLHNNSSPLAVTNDRHHGPGLPQVRRPFALDEITRVGPLITKSFNPLSIHLLNQCCFHIISMKWRWTYVEYTLNWRLCPVGRNLESPKIELRCLNPLDFLIADYHGHNIKKHV